MYKIILGLLAVLLSCSAVSAQLPMTGAGLPKPAAAGGGYTGPGDVISGADLWFGLRCYNAAYSGNVADVWDASTGSTTETLITCASGSLVTTSPTALATTCASGCRVKVLYDQSGALWCQGAITCTLTQATNGSRPTFTQNCIGSLPCITFNGATFFNGNPPLTGAAAPNWTISGVSSRTGSFTTQQDVIYLGGSNLQYTTSANTVGLNTSSLMTATASDSVVHVLQAVAANGSGTINVDGTDTSGSPAASGIGAGGILSVGNANTGLKLTGTIMETGMWPIAFSSGQRTSMCHNQFTYWGTATSC